MARSVGLRGVRGVRWGLAAEVWGPSAVALDRDRDLDEDEGLLADEVDEGSPILASECSH